MKKAAIQIVISLIALTGVVTLVKAQDSRNADACTGPVYKGKEVSRRVKIPNS